MGSFGYADDCVLLSPMISSLRRQLDVCDSFSTEFNVLFNPDKYQLLHCSNLPKQLWGIEYNGSFIKTCDSAMHLGYVLTSNNISKASIDMSCTNFCVAVNSVLSLFPKAHSHVKYYLLNQFCMSLYGCVLWDLSSNYTDTFYVKWRKVIRQLLRIPYTTHCRYLHLLCDTLSVEIQLLKRPVKFIGRILNSINDVLTMCGKLAINGSLSAVSKNINLVAQVSGCNKYKWVSDFLTSKLLSLISTEYKKETLEDKVTCSVIRDAIQLRDEKTSNVTQAELTFLIDQLCTE